MSSLARHRHRHRLTRRLGALALVALVATPAAAARGRLRIAASSGRPAIATSDLIVNGSFEAPVLADATWDVFRDIRGWQTSSGAGIEIQRGVAGSPFAGAQLVELDSHSRSSMYQIVDTRPRTLYRLTYRASARPGTAVDDNVLVVRWNGQVVDTFRATEVAGDTAWQRRTVDVLATGRETRLEFADASTDDSLGAYLDDVTLVPISTP